MRGPKEGRAAGGHFRAWAAGRLWRHALAIPGDEAKSLVDEAPDLTDEQIFLAAEVKSLMHDVFPVIDEVRNPTRERVFLIDDVFGLMDDEFLVIVEAANLIEQAANLTVEVFSLPGRPSPAAALLR